MLPENKISTILKHDKKDTSYKFALLRAINDVALNFPDLRNASQDVAVPLEVLAQFWIAYYWPFADANNPIIQRRSGGNIAFQLELTKLRSLWQQEIKIDSQPSDGFFFINELRIPRKRDSYSPELLSIYQDVRKKIEKAMVNGPICHAGSEGNKVFKKPKKYSDMGDTVVTIPGTKPNDKCLIIPADLWQTFQKMSLWIEALCIHEWCLFSETLKQEDGQRADRSLIYRLLTDRPDNRIPLTWERNHINLLLMEGREFVCPWTEKQIVKGKKYDLDHLLPVSLYPINELWNLVPADPYFNSHIKRDRLPTQAKLQQAQPHLELAYRHYSTSQKLLVALQEDVAVRFLTVSSRADSFPTALSVAVVDLINIVAESRNLARF